MYYLVMLPDSIDSSLATVATISGLAFAWWGHHRELEKERQRAKRAHADAVKREYAAERDFGHIKRDIEQLKLNISHLDEENEQRLNKLEVDVGKMVVSLEVIRELIRPHDK